MALDTNGNVYSWGNNYSGQCGYESSSTFINIPNKINAFDGEIVDVIKCGDAHSYIRIISGKHYLFGSNGDNECLYEDYAIDQVEEPYRFDEVIKSQYKIKSIIDVYLGNYNTKLVCIPQ